MSTRFRNKLELRDFITKQANTRTLHFVYILSNELENGIKIIQMTLK